ncbi:MAG: aliphatic sulfonate ABC transporter substrate-binding protein [Anaerolineae bacterium]|nr:aliphatic sulfonate ABC transporter substrate-binding protein [Anaerolineae bacterium]
MHALRRITLTVIAAALLLATFTVQAQDDAPFVLRVGHQRGDYFTILKNNGSLEAAIKAEFGDDATVEYTLFPAGPPLLEAVNGGSIDVGGVGNTPPIFAQAATVPLVYFASQLSTSGSALIVPENSPIQSLEELTGKTVAFTTGSSANYFVIEALRTVGLDFPDIVPAPLAPADARAAFDSGSIDAWVIWDPFLTIAVSQVNARPLIDSSQLEPTRGYYLASELLANENPAAVQIVFDQLQETITWVRDNPEDYAEFLESETTVPAEVWLAIRENRPIYDLEYIADDIVASQQAIADVFAELELIPNAIDVSTIIWRPEGFDPTEPSLAITLLGEEEAETEETEE